MAHVLLINPHSQKFASTKERHIPLGILYLSSYLKKDGHLTYFIDMHNEQITSQLCGASFDMEKYYNLKIKQIILDYKPDIIGFSVHFAGRFHPMLNISGLIKKDFPKVPIAIGGIHPTIFAQEILREYKSLDFILQGESEVSFLELINSIELGYKHFNQIDGLAYRNDSEIIVNKKEKFIEDIDSLPFPDYDLIHIRDYYFDTSEWINPKTLPINFSMHILSSRSCPRQCSFCSMFIVHGPRYRIRSASNVVNEIEYLYHRFKHRYFSFMDDNLTLNKKRAVKICDEIIKRGLDIQFDTPNGLEINSLDEELINLLTKAGMVKTCFAVESGSEEIRKSINKPLSQDKIYSVFNLIRKYPHLDYNVFFIIGFPNETKQTLADTYNLIKQLNLRKAIISFATPFPGTRLYDECMANNLIETDKSRLHNIDTFYFAHNEPFFKPYKLEKQDLIDFRLRVYTELNMTKQLKSLCSNNP